MEYRVWAGADWATIDVPEVAGEPLAIPIVSAIVLTADGSRLLLQRRDRPGEPTRGLLEVPAGRWRAGEGPWQALRREVAEEAGLEVQSVEIEETRHEAHIRRPFLAFRPLAVAVGTEGAVPVLCIAFVCKAQGETGAQSRRDRRSALVPG